MGPKTLKVHTYAIYRDPCLQIRCIEAMKEEFGVEFRCQIGAHEVINFMS